MYRITCWRQDLEPHLPADAADRPRAPLEPGRPNDQTRHHSGLYRPRCCRQTRRCLPAQVDPAAEIHHRVRERTCRCIRQPYIGRSAAMASRPRGEQFWVVSRHRDPPAPQSRWPSSSVGSCRVRVRPRRRMKATATRPKSIFFNPQSPSLRKMSTADQAGQSEGRPQQIT